MKFYGDFLSFGTGVLVTAIVVFLHADYKATILKEYLDVNGCVSVGPPPPTNTAYGVLKDGFTCGGMFVAIPK